MSLNETKATSDIHLSPGTVVKNTWQKFWGVARQDFFFFFLSSSSFYEVKFGSFFFYLLFLVILEFDVVEKA